MTLHRKSTDEMGHWDTLWSPTCGMSLMLTNCYHFSDQCPAATHFMAGQFSNLPGAFLCVTTGRPIYCVPLFANYFMLENCPQTSLIENFFFSASVYLISIDDLPGGDSVITTLSTSYVSCLLYTSPSPRDRTRSRMPSSA